jgi:hypothetical protein
VNTFRGSMGDDDMLRVARKLIRGGHQLMTPQAGASAGLI